MTKKSPSNEIQEQPREIITESPLDRVIAFDKSLMDIMLKACKKNFSGAFTLYGFYYYTAKWQKTNQPYCTTSFVAKGLYWSKDKVKKYKKILMDLGLIENIELKDAKTGKTIKWFIKVSFIFKKETLSNLLPEGGEKNTPGGGVKNHPGGGVKKTPTNALSTNTNTLSTNKVYNTIGNQDSSKDILGISTYEIIEPIKVIINKSILLGNFSNHKFPKTGQEPSKTIKTLIKYLKALEKGNFFKLVDIDKSWLDKCGITQEQINGINRPMKWGEIKRLFIKSAERFGNRRKEEFGDNKKSMLTKSLADFIFNSRSNTSQFLYNLFNEPGESNTSLLNKHKCRFEKKLRNKLSDVYNNNKDKPTRDEKAEMLFYAKMAKLRTWYEKNYEDLDFYNRVKHNNHFNFRVGSFEALVDKVGEYYEYARGMWRRDFLDPVEFSDDWEGFTIWLRTVHDLELDVRENELKQAREKVEKEKKNKRDDLLQSEIDSGKTEDEAREYLKQREEVKKLLPKHIKILEKKYKDLGKHVRRSILVSTAERNAEIELGYDE